jgi:hypothetical protein
MKRDHTSIVHLMQTRGPGGERLQPHARARLTVDRRIEIATRYKAGEKSVDLAREYGIAESYPATLAARYGMSRPPRKAWAKEAARLDAIGMTRVAIAAKLGVSDTRVCDVLGPKPKTAPLPKWSPLYLARKAATASGASR